MSSSMVPAHKRPWRSQRPSLKRMAGAACSTGASDVAASVPSACGLSEKRPLSMPAIHSPGASARGAMQAIISFAVHFAWPPSPACQRFSVRAGMSTQ
jgi:hypothetical protein